jgi:hypothetical protein
LIAFDNGDTNEARFVGPYCSPDDSTSIHLGVFAADGCAAGPLDAAAAETLLLRDYPEFGVPVLYLTTTMVENKCLSCVEEEEGSDTENEPVQQEQEGAKYRVSDVCLAPYVGAAKCEADMDSYHKDTEGCDYIRNVLPWLASPAAAASGASVSAASNSSSSSSGPSPQPAGTSRRSGGGGAGGRGKMMMMMKIATTTKAKAKDSPSSSRQGCRSAH